MVRKIKFALQMTDGMDITTIEELRLKSDIHAILQAYYNKKLMAWLRSRGHHEEVEAIEMLDENDENFIDALADILGLCNQTVMLDIQSIKERENKIAKLRQYTSDMTYMDKIDSIAFEQSDIEKIIDKGYKIIYLCGNQQQDYSINLAHNNIEYIGVFGVPKVDIPNVTREKLIKSGLRFRDVEMVNSLQNMSRTIISYQTSIDEKSMDIKIDRLKGEQLQRTAQNKLRFYHHTSISLGSLAQIVTSHFNGYDRNDMKMWDVIQLNKSVANVWGNLFNQEGFDSTSMIGMLDVSHLKVSLDQHIGSNYCISEFDSTTMIPMIATDVLKCVVNQKFKVNR